MSSVLRYVALLTVLTLTLAGMPVALPVAAAAMPAAPLLTADGALRADALAPGALDLTGWNVTLDPARGPVFSPAALASTTGWEHLGARTDGALNGEVNALAIDNNGRVYVGGAFTDVAGIATADYVAMWNPATQTWSALGSNGNGNGALNGNVLALTIASNGKVYVGGRFSNAAGIAAADSVAVWDPATQTWSALGSNGSGNGALNYGVFALAVAPDGKVYAGGDFTDAGGNAAADRIAMWNPATQTWSALGSDSSGEGILNLGVRALAITSDGKVYAGGAFTDVAGNAAADYVAVWNPATQTWSALGSNGSGNGALNRSVSALTVSPNGKVYVGGAFDDAAGIAAADSVAMWDPATQTWSALGTSSAAYYGSVAAIAVDSAGKVYIGGNFTNARGNAAADYIAMWNPATQTWSALGSNGSGNGALTSPVAALAISPDNKVYVGGAFDDAAGIAFADYTAVWDPADGAWGAMDGNGYSYGALNDRVRALAVAPDGKVYVGGAFTNAGGNAAADYIAMWDPVTQTWNALGSDSAGNGLLNYAVEALAIAPDGKVYAGGDFTNVGGNDAADGVAMWDPATQTWNALGSNGNGNGAVFNVSTLAIAPDGKVYVGGYFTNAADIAAADYVAMWDPATQTWNALGSNGNGDGAIGRTSTLAATLDNEERYCLPATQLARNIAAPVIDPDSNDRPCSHVAQIAYNVSALAVAADGKVYVGSMFTNMAGIAAADYIAMWDPATETWSALGSNGYGNGAISSAVTALAIAPDGKVYVGSSFSSLAVWNPATQTWSTLRDNRGNVLNFGVSALAVDADHRVYAGGPFTNAVGNPAADYVVAWDPFTQSWSALGSNGSGDGAIGGANATSYYTVVDTLATAPNGKLYVGGNFLDTANNPLADFVAAYQMPDVFRVFVPAINR